MGTDGELSELVNLIPKNGELVNVRGLDIVVDLDLSNKDAKLLCVHKVVEKIVYLFSDGRNVEYYVEGAKNTVTFGPLDDVEGIHKGVAIGNIVVLTGTNHNAYLRWTGDGYKYIGTHIPYLDIRIWSDSEFHDEKTWRPRIPMSSLGEVIEDWIKTEAKEKYYDVYLNSLKKDYFMESFFIRYAYRLYDNSIAYCSPPILIPCATKYPSLILDIHYLSEKEGIEIQFKAWKSWMKVYPNIKAGTLDTYKDFSDIIRSVEFYISPIQMNGSNVHFVPKNNRIGQNSVVYSGGYFDLSTYTIAGRYGVWFTTDQLDEKVIGASSFHLLKKIDYSTFINCEYVVLNGTDDNGESIAEFNLRDIWSRPSLIDDTPFEATVGENLFAYNSRLFLSKTKRWPFQGVDVGCFFPYSSRGNKIKAVYVKIESNSGTVVVKLNKKEYYDYCIGYYIISEYDYGSACRWFYYPNEDATEVTFETDNTRAPFITNKLKRHPMLRGCYLYNGMDSVFKSMSGQNLAKLEETDTKHEELYNEIAYTNPNNMFVIPGIFRFRIGEGEVYGLATSSVALSEGQFGQFPIYVFCSDGIWALTIAKDGSIERADPVSRDVCNNPASITQIDGAVVFTTDQGLMMIQGSEVVNLSGAMEGFNVDESEYFKTTTDEKKFFESYGKEGFDDLVISETKDFREILKDCTIAYDYANRMLRIFPMGESFKGKYYVFSLESREFATVYLGAGNPVTTVVPDYPSSIVQIGQALYRPSERDDNKNTKKGLLLTRPIMLDEPFALKKLQDMRLHYSKFDGTSKCHVIVYVSNDGTNWAIMKSLRKRSYKYYRFAIITDMKDMDALSGMVLRYDLERTNKLR